MALFDTLGDGSDVLVDDIVPELIEEAVLAGLTAMRVGCDTPWGLCDPKKVEELIPDIANQPTRNVISGVVL